MKNVKSIISYILFLKIMSILASFEETLIVILPLLGSIAFMTLAERKVMGLHKIKTFKPFGLENLIIKYHPLYIMN